MNSVASYLSCEFMYFNQTAVYHNTGYCAVFTHTETRGETIKQPWDSTSLSFSAREWEVLPCWMLLPQNASDGSGSWTDWSSPFSTHVTVRLCVCAGGLPNTPERHTVSCPYQSSYFIQQNSAKKQNKTTKPNTTKQNEINSRRQKHCCWTMSDNFQPEVILPYPPMQEGCPHWRAG